jgi:hypothetical protein
VIEVYDVEVRSELASNRLTLHSLINKAMSLVEGLFMTEVHTYLSYASSLRSKTSSSQTFLARCRLP